MSRNLLIFGQGSMACHPYIRDEFYAIPAKIKRPSEVIIWKHITILCKILLKHFALPGLVVIYSVPNML